MAIDFPNTPEIDQEFTVGNITWIWNGTSWDSKIGDNSNLIFEEKTASYTIVLSDKNKTIEMNLETENTFTIPLDSSVNFPIGSQVNVLQSGIGQTTIVGASAVTVVGTPGLKLRGQWSAATVTKRAANVWVAIGDLSQ
jgi:hypothetical protein